MSNLTVYLQKLEKQLENLQSKDNELTNKLHMLELKQENTEGVIRDMKDDIKSIKTSINKGTYWLITILLTVIGTFIMDKFF